MTTFFLGGYGEESLCRVQLEGSRLTVLSRYPVKNASYICFGPDRRTLYAVGETQRFLGEESGSVHAFSLEADGTLKQTSVKPSGGADPCHIAVAGGLLLVSNYTSGSLARFHLEADGSLGEALPLISPQGRGPNRQRQEHAHVHQAQAVPGNWIAFVDLGTDAVRFLPLPEADAPAPHLTEVRTPAGYGPRHAVFPASGDAWYLLCELSSQLLVYRGDPGDARLVARLPVGEGDAPDYPAALRLSPDGRLLAATGRGQNVVSLFRITDSGLPVKLAEAQSGGDWPRDVQFTPDGQRLICANERGDSLTLFDLEGGRLRMTGRLSTPAPTCILFE